MCGLMAGIGKLSSNRIVALGTLNEERGDDSVGLGFNSPDGPHIEKIAKRPMLALNLDLRKAVTEAAVSGLFIGHTRRATQGDVTSRNAHPFLVEKIAFAHNGVIVNDKEFGEYEVDSESLIHGIKTKDFSKYEGPIALVWIEDGKLKAYRCGNPLSRGRHAGATYLASEGDYLRDVDCTGVKELAEGLIYTFHDAQRITTERVKRNKTFSKTTYVNGVGYPKTEYDYDYDYAYKSKPSHIIIPSEVNPPPLSIPAGKACSGCKRYYGHDGGCKILQVKGGQDICLKCGGVGGHSTPCLEDWGEDFRTPKDIADAQRMGPLDGYCVLCSHPAILSEEGYCIDCLERLDDMMDADAVPVRLSPDMTGRND